MIEPKLAAPGAGIPFYAHIYNRLITKPFTIKNISWEECESAFTAAHKKLKAELSPLSEKEATTRILVPPQPGLEDSSRFWSAAMTARHIVVTARPIEKIIVALSRHEKLDLIVDVAKVKPELDKNSPDAIQEFFEMGDTILERLRQNVKDRNSSETHRHPWFGGLTSKGWLWLLGRHSFIHLRQVREIKKGLSKG